MIKRSVIQAVLTTAAIAFLSGCASPWPAPAPFKAYNGAVQPISAIATLHATPPAFISVLDGAPGPLEYDEFKVFIVHTSLVSIDGQTIELLPGQHTVTLNYFRAHGTGATRSTYGSTFMFSAEAGKAYDLTANYKANDEGWRAGVAAGLGASTYGNITYALRDASTGVAIPLNPVPGDKVGATK